MSVVDFVRGPVVERGVDSVVLAIGGGSFGMRVLVPVGVVATLPDPPAEALLYTHLHLREDSLTLYGFAGREERALFIQLLGVTGVGPKVALAALSAMSTGQLAAAVEAEDVSVLARIPGIGRKTAARIVLDLKGKLPESLPTPLAAGNGRVRPSDPVRELTAAALRETFGFTPAEVTSAIESLPSDPALSVEDAIRLSLQQLRRL